MSNLLERDLPCVNLLPGWPHSCGWLDPVTGPTPAASVGVLELEAAQHSKPGALMKCGHLGNQRILSQHHTDKHGLI